MIEIFDSKVEDAPLLAELAAAIWTEHYTPIIGSDQVAYMLEHFQSTEAISRQMTGNVDYYCVRKNGQPIGYIALKPEADSLFISKLYLAKDARGQGIARLMLNFIEQQASLKRFSKLSLTVNKQNPALHAYKRLGFQVVKSVIADIGQGYVMDDYLLEKTLSSSHLDTTDS